MTGHSPASQSASRRSWPIVVRRARPADREAVLAFASATFDGWDYVPRAWDEWIAGRDGVLLVATPGANPSGTDIVDADGQPLHPDTPIAVARVALLARGEAWLEGIRVDPRVRGMAVATDLQVAELHWAEALGARHVRYATGERNEGSHRLGGHHGFEVLVALRSWVGPDGEHPHRDDAQTGYDAAARAEASRRREAILARLAADGLVIEAGRAAADGWWTRLARDETFAAYRQLYEYRSWSFEPLTADRFREHVVAGEVVTVEARDADPVRWALALMPRLALPAEDVGMHLGVLVGDGELALELLRRCAAAGAEPLRVRVPDPDPPLLRGHRSAFEAAGFRSRESTLHILGRPLDAAHPPPEPERTDLLVYGERPHGVASAPAR